MPTLLTSPRISRDEFQRRMAPIWKEDFAFVRQRLTSSDGFNDAEAKQAQDEFLKFAGLFHLTDDELVPTRLADRFWHAFILHTQQYSEWCDRHFHAFAHHHPGHTPPDGWRRTVELAAWAYGIDWLASTAGASCKCKGGLSGIPMDGA